MAAGYLMMPSIEAMVVVSTSRTAMQEIMEINDKALSVEGVVEGDFVRLAVLFITAELRCRRSTVIYWFLKQ